MSKMKAKNINLDSPNNEQSAIPSISGIVEIDMPFTRDSATDTNTYSGFCVRVGVGKPTNDGVLVLEDQDGLPVVHQEVLSGEVIYLNKMRRVLSSASTPKGNFTTTCTHMTWGGGSY